MRLSICKSSKYCLFSRVHPQHNSHAFWPLLTLSTENGSNMLLPHAAEHFLCQRALKQTRHMWSCVGVWCTVVHASQLKSWSVLCSIDAMLQLICMTRATCLSLSLSKTVKSQEYSMRASWLKQGPLSDWVGLVASQGWSEAWLGECHL